MTDRGVLLIQNVDADVVWSRGDRRGGVRTVEQMLALPGSIVEMVDCTVLIKDRIYRIAGKDRASLFKPQKLGKSIGVLVILKQDRSA